MQREYYPTIKDFKNMGLTDYQIKELIQHENIKHGISFKDYNIFACGDDFSADGR